ncbi:hypothetical protein VRRI112168_19860 [Vreelandella rituensis]
MTDRIHNSHAAKVRREFVVTFGEIGIAYLRPLAGRMNKPFDHLDDVIAFASPHHRPVGIGHGHQIAHQPSIQRQRIRQSGLLVGTGDV